MLSKSVPRRTQPSVHRVPGICPGGGGGAGGRSLVMTTYILLAPGWELVGDISPPFLCVYPGISRGDLYLYTVIDLIVFFCR
jgi:hypothetical protein